MLQIRGVPNLYLDNLYIICVKKRGGIIVTWCSEGFSPWSNNFYVYEDMFAISIIILFLFFIIIKYMFMYIALLGEFATLHVHTGTRLLLHPTKSP